MVQFRPITVLSTVPFRKLSYSCKIRNETQSFRSVPEIIPIRKYSSAGIKLYQILFIPYTAWRNLYAECFFFLQHLTAMKMPTNFVAQRTSEVRKKAELLVKDTITSTKTDWLIDNGVATNFGVGVEEPRPEGPWASMGFLGRGQPAPLHQLWGLRERCKLPQRGPRRSPGRRRVFLYSEPSDCLSQHLRTCCI